jgi:hypothetical protein
MRLERIARDAWAQGIKATVYNCPEIRTNSSDIFAGVELPLISLLHALKKKAAAPGPMPSGRPAAPAGRRPHPGRPAEKVAAFHGEVMQGFRDFAAWPMPNSPAQADLTIGTSDDIAQMHTDRKALITDLLSAWCWKPPAR